MNEFKVKLNSIARVKKFLEVVSVMNEDVDIIVGRYIVDAKSALGIFSIDLTRVLTVKVHTTDPATCEEFRQKIERFIVDGESR